MTFFVHLWQYLAESFLEWEVFQTNVYRKPKHMFYFWYFFFRKSFLFWNNMEKYNRAGQASDDNMVHALCMLDK